MKKLELSLISGTYERVAALLDGTIPVEGVDLVWSHSHPSETFWRQLKFGEFDVAEMSMSSLLIAKSRGHDMVAIPVFPSRRFMHMALYVHRDSGIGMPGSWRANASAWASTSRPRRCGLAAPWSMTSACPSSASTGTWSVARS